MLLRWPRLRAGGSIGLLRGEGDGPIPNLPIDVTAVNPYHHGMTLRLDMYPTPEFLKLLDNWRRQQGTILSRAAAVRLLTTRAILADQGAPAYRPRKSEDTPA